MVRFSKLQKFSDATIDLGLKRLHHFMRELGLEIHVCVEIVGIWFSAGSHILFEISMQGLLIAVGRNLGADLVGLAVNQA